MENIFNEFKPAHFFKAYELMKPGIYLIRHVNSNKVYIGSSQNINERLKRHFNELKSNRHISKELQNLFNKNNLLEYFIKFTNTREEAFDEEQKLLDIYITEDSIINAAPNARSQTGFKHSEETKQQMSVVRSTPEMKAFCSNLNKGRIVNEETRQKISLGSMGRKPSDKNKAITSKLFKGTPRTKEAIENMRIANLSRSKPIIVDGIKYDSVRVYHEKFGVGTSTIEYRLNNTKPHFDNWSYINE